MPNRKKEALTGPQTEAAVDAQPEVPLKDQVLEMWTQGQSRSEIAKHFDIPYQRVFALTKGVEGGPPNATGRARVMVEASEKLTEAGLEELVGMARADAIRQLYTGDDERFAGKLGPISRLLDTSYQVAFQATKALRQDEDGELEDESTETESEDEDATEEEEEEEFDEDEAEAADDN